jgi:WD40 repeat protein
MITIPLQRQLPGELAFSPDGSLLALTGTGVSLRVFDGVTGQLRWSVPSLPNDNRTGSVSFSPNNRYVIRTWIPSEIFDVSTGQKIESVPKKQLPGSAEWPGVLSKGVSSVGQLSWDGQWELWGNPLQLRNRTTKKWSDLIGLRGKTKGTRTKYPLGVATLYASSRDGTLLAFGDASMLHIVRFEDLVECKSIGFSSSGLPVVPILTTLQLPRKHFQAAAFTMDGNRLLTVSNEATVRVWETVNWKECHAYEWEAGPLKSIALSSDGTRAAITGTQKIVIWDLDS